jgi:hypothetical protein
MSLKKGIPFSDGFPSSFFPAVLEEDFIITATATKRPFCKAKVDPFYTNMKGVYPLTLVPSWFFVYDLKKGDKIYVAFQDNDQNYPVLMLVDKDLNSDLYTKVSMPTSSYLTFPSAEETLTSFYVGPDFYIIGTKTITVLKKGALMQVWTADKMYVVATDFGVKAQKFELDLGGQHIQITSDGSGTLALNGTAIPAVTGILNCIGICPLTTLPHAGIQAVGL